MKNNYKVVIVGGGASGLLCAIELLRGLKAICPSDLLLLEGNDRVGKKLIATGNGQGNLCNSDFSKNFYHGETSFINSFISSANDINIEQYFYSLGIPLTQEQGKKYPLSKQANTVLDLIRLNLSAKGCNIATSQKVLSISKNKNGYALKTSSDTYYAQYVVLAFGGKAGKQFGTDGSSFSLAQSLGHKVTELYPSLVQLKTDLTKIRGLKGLKERVKLTAYDGNVEKRSTIGELLFTEFGISGNAVFNLSGYLTDAKKPWVKVEFLPDYNEEQIVKILAEREKLGYIPLEETLTGLINKRVGQAVLKTIIDKTPKGITRALKNFELMVTGNLGFNYAQVTKGGISTDEVDQKSMESKLNNGLYVIGEALNVDGDCGGYNLTFAFVTGIVCAKDIKTKCAN